MIWGPTYQEMFDPTGLPAGLRQEALRALKYDELAPINLFNITWRDDRGRVRVVKLPPELTGVDANILVLVGKHFPSGSHKVGPAYSTLMEAEVDGEIKPGSVTVVGPSTGNFGIGTAYVSRLKGYPALVVMPDNMSDERYERIRHYGGELDLTPGTESDVILTLERTHQQYMRNPKYKVLAQFELLPNYRFHRYVTGRSAVEAAAAFGDGRIAAFVSAPGSAGTIAAGDEIKARFDDAAIVALEPAECPTLFDNGRGTHRIEGIGDKMVTLIHNVLTTDYVMLIHDDDCVRGLRVIQDGAGVLHRVLGVPEGTAQSLEDLFGISGVCNVLGAIKTAKALRLPEGRNIVTVATDGFDRYPSVMADLAERSGAIDQATLRLWATQVFRGVDARQVLDVRPATEKARLFKMKEEVWSQFGYGAAQLEAMKSQAFWDEEYARVADYDRRLEQMRAPLA
jgi:cysteine synthase